MNNWQPDYTNIVEAARNRRPARLPLYDHQINPEMIETIENRALIPLLHGDDADLREYYRRFCCFCRRRGYDTISMEILQVDLVQGGKGLMGQADGIIKIRADFNAFPWDDLFTRFTAAAERRFSALEAVLPDGMKVVGGVGNGPFELAQDFCSFTGLSFLKADDPVLYRDLFRQIGSMIRRNWEWLLRHYGDLIAVCRIGDDLGFKSTTLLPPDDIREHIIPAYRDAAALAHRAGKPFLLHSCGNIFSVMDDIISQAGIDAKHSNEDEIAPFSRWRELYGRRIALFGGLDMNVLCLKSEQEVKTATRELINREAPQGGFALGCGNSIPEYIPPENYLAMTETVREFRGDQRS